MNLLFRSLLGLFGSPPLYIGGVSDPNKRIDPNMKRISAFKGSFECYMIRISEYDSNHDPNNFKHQMIRIKAMPRHQNFGIRWQGT